MNLEYLLIFFLGAFVFNIDRFKHWLEKKLKRFAEEKMREKK